MKDQATQLTAAETDQVAGGISPVPVPTTMPIPDNLRRRHSIVDPIFDAAQLVEPGRPFPRNPARPLFPGAGSKTDPTTAKAVL